MSDAAQDLQELTGAPRIVRIRDRDIQLRPPRPFSDEFVKILRLALPMAAHFAGETGEVDIGRLLEEHGERVRPLCALLAGVDESWLKELEFDEAVTLIRALVEENLDFFARRMVPALASAMSDLSGKLSTTSPTTRNGSGGDPRAAAGPTPPSS